MHQDQLEQQKLSEEEEALLQEKADHMLLYGGLLRYGIDLFGPDGSDCGGVNYLLLLLNYFETAESYGICARIRDWKTEYEQRWPDKIKE